MGWCKCECKVEINLVEKDKMGEEPKFKKKIKILHTSEIFMGKMMYLNF